MKEILKFIASLVVVYLTMCLIALNWTPMFTYYISASFETRLLLIIELALVASLVYCGIKIAETFI